MPIPQPIKLDAYSLNGGRIYEEFESAMRKVLKNILDQSTDASAKREIILKVGFKPQKDNRGIITTELHCDVKLAPPKDSIGMATIYLDSNGNAQICTNDISQNELGFEPVSMEI
jgi:hypothetical protein